MKLLSIVLVSVALFACSEPKKEVAFDSLESARLQAKSNAVQNAQLFRQSNATYSEYGISGRVDSTQMPDCPQGDGWASVDLISKEGKPTIKIKCSTVSLALSCFEEADFNKKAFAGEENHCQPTTKVPFPIPKLTQ